MDKMIDWIERSNKVHDNKYDYSLIKEITNGSVKYPILCEKHGVFYKSFLKHVCGKQGCPKCSGKFRYDTDSFIQEINGKDNVNECTFEKVNYINNKTKITVTCHHKDENGNEHGDFEITPSHLLNGEGCPKCRYIKSASSNRRTIKDIIEEARKVHGNKYGYDKIVEYRNDRIKYPIICPEHGVFEQTMNNHIKGGQGCPICGRLKTNDKKKVTFEEFVERASKIHNNKYQYIKESYKGINNYVDIICPKHGVFSMKAGNHLFLEQNCPKCSYAHSKGENEVYEWLCSVFGAEEVFTHVRNILDSNEEIDIYLPNFNLGIEYNGLFWHSEKKKDRLYHLNKTKQCNSKGIRLFHIFEDEWLNKQDIVKSMLMNICNKTSKKLYARKCIIKEISFNESKAFIDKNHLQGNCNSSIRLGLFYNNELVSVMTFGKARHFVGSNRFKYELLRFCNKQNLTIIGGASKLFKYFIKNFDPKSIVSYADRRWSMGNLYNTIGFTKYNESTPNYYYIINNKREYRYNLRKSILVKKHNCPENISEHEFCLSKGWFRIYDCGCLCYKWEKTL